MALDDFLKVVVPEYASDRQVGACTVREQDSGATLKSVEWSNGSFVKMDHSMSKDLTGFFSKAKSPEIFRYDCDGVIFFEEDGRKYMFLNELKSGFSTQDLYHAKQQIISSFLKTNMLMHLSSVYHIEDFIVKGFIFTRRPKPDFLVSLYRGDMDRSDSSKMAEYRLATRMLVDGTSVRVAPNITRICLKPTECLSLKGLPLGDRGIFKQLELYHVIVPYTVSDYSMDTRLFL